MDARRWDLWLSVVWRVVAIVLIVTEAVTQHEPREALLVLYAAMLGLPTIVRARGRDDEPGGGLR